MRPPDEVRRELVEQWVNKAHADLGVARLLVDEAAPYLDAIGFHAQQAAEKYIKAYLTNKSIEFTKTHNLMRLLQLVAGSDEAIASSLQVADALTVYGVEFRYPGDYPQMTEADAHQAVQLATFVRDTILPLLA